MNKVNLRFSLGWLAKKQSRRWLAKGIGISGVEGASRAWLGGPDQREQANDKAATSTTRLPFTNKNKVPGASESAGFALESLP